LLIASIGVSVFIWWWVCGDIRSMGELLRGDAHPGAGWRSAFWEARRARSGEMVVGGTRPGFVDVTANSGIDFVHSSPGSDSRLNPEMKGPGIVAFDADNDGWTDLLFPDYSARQVLGSGPTSSARLYRGSGGFRFEDSTKASGLLDEFCGMGASAADIDRDGDIDLFIAGYGSNRLYLNDGRGRFDDFTEASGLRSDQWATSATFLDYDLDGNLDLLVLGYTQWTSEEHARCAMMEQNPTLVKSLTGSGKEPNVFERSHESVGVNPACLGPQKTYLWKGNGDGTFTDVSGHAGLQSLETRGLGIAILDLEGDRYPDILIANDGMRNQLLSNQRNGKFREIGLAAGVALDPSGNHRAGMGIDAAYLFEDDRICVSIGFFEAEIVPLYCQNRRDGSVDPYHFVDIGERHGVGRETNCYFTFGVRFVDYDMDGWKDLLLVNGHLSGRAAGMLDPSMARQPLVLYQNLQGTRLAEWVLPEDSDFGRPLLGRAVATADIDHDGDMDIVVAQNGGRPAIFRNDTDRKGRHSLMVRLAGVRSNPHGLGAHVETKCGDMVRREYVTLHASFMASSPPDLFFGLGQCEGPVTVTVRWPSGQTDVHGGVDIDRSLLFTEGREEVETIYAW